MTPLRVLDLPADRMEAEAVAAFFFEDERPLRGPAALLDWRLNGLLTDLLVRDCAAGHTGEKILVPNNGKLRADRILFVGGGSRCGMKQNIYQGLLRDLLESCLRARFFRIALCLEPPEGLEQGELEKTVAEMLDGMGMKCLLSVE